MHVHVCVACRKKSEGAELDGREDGRSFCVPTFRFATQKLT